MKTLFVPAGALPAEGDAEENPQSAPAIKDPVQSLLTLLAPGLPTLRWNSHGWEIAPESLSFEFLSLEASDVPGIREGNVVVRLDPLALVERLQTLSGDAASPREAIGRALGGVLQHVGDEFRLLQIQPAAVVSVAQYNGSGVDLRIHALLLPNGDASSEISASDQLLDQLFEGATVCIGGRTSEDEGDVEGRGMREIGGALLLSGLFAFSGLAKAAPSETPLLEQVDAGNFTVVKTKKPLVGQTPIRINKSLLDEAAQGEVKVIVDIAAQRAYLYVNGSLAIDSPVSTARSSSHTPRGTFTITEKRASGKISTIYHCPLPYWMRLSETAVGMHIGDLPGYPASHGCIRLPAEGAALIFAAAKKGTTVTVVDRLAEGPTALAQNN